MKLILVASNRCNSSTIKLIKFMDNVYDFGIGFMKVPPTNKKLPWPKSFPTCKKDNKL